MRTLTFLLVFIVFMQAHAQKNVQEKFATEVCSCFEKIKLQTLTTSTAIQKEMVSCYTMSIMAHQKELKKQNIIDFDAATDEDMQKFWANIFTKCPEVAKAPYDRIEILEEQEAAQSFHGVILYVMDIDVSGSFKKMGITREQMLGEMRKEEAWFDTLYVFYKLGNYAKIGNNKQQTQRIYDAFENTIYSFKTAGDGVCSVQDAVDLDLNGEPDKPTITHVDSAVTIMGVPCKIMRMKWKLSQIDYYYNSTLAQVNPELFSKHSSEGFSEFVKQTKCLPLQVTTSTMGVTVIQTAFEVNPTKVDPNMFSVPELVEDESLNAFKLPGVKMMRIKE